MRPTTYAALALIAGAVVGCSDADGVAGAKGETPVRYLICGVGEKSCFIAARFKDLEACESHKRWSEMLCDSKSTPGVMNCRADPGPQVGKAYCTL